MGVWSTARPVVVADTGSPSHASGYSARPCACRSTSASLPIDRGGTMDTRSSLAAPLLDRMLVGATVAEAEPVGPRMRRIRLHVPTAADLAWTPGQHVR